ncbi:hypothetical protein RJ639_017888 [Escallonia herrerae]|uniref:Uncharacterized protein n=1 Tax=Escallonia herrerae TaxID=1293975 RepID=A0AA88V9Z0_9ASTE|nr:hypothetical protein RJ639_017888 [Escallonia herrerae]
MGLPRFTRPRGGDGGSSPNLYVANCGPAVGVSYDAIASAFSTYGALQGVYPADESGTRVIVSYYDESSAQAALNALDGHPCPDLCGRSLHIRYSVFQPPCQVHHNDSVQVALEASDLNIPGIYLMHDFITAEEEKELLAAVDGSPWKSLAKRRVQHYGYEFRYETRNVDPKQHLGELPSFVSPILQRISVFKKLDDAARIVLNQLTVNEYPPGVGLSPHIDTHSAFEGSIYSLSLAGPCIMEFRKYSEGACFSKPVAGGDREEEDSGSRPNVLRRAIFLAPRSMLLLSGEARYAWHHYIPHHKVCLIPALAVLIPLRVSAPLRSYSLRMI